MNKPTKTRESDLPPSANLTVQEYYEGILPHPAILEQFKAIDPTLPDRIMKSFEVESEHRRRMQRWTYRIAMFSEIAGVLAGLMAVAGICWLGYLFMVNGHPTEGATIVVSLVLGLASIFVLRKYRAAGTPEKREAKT